MPKKVETALDLFRRRLRGSYHDAEAYLFGSYAKGNWLEDSDVDIIVVSDEFESRAFPERVAAVRSLAPKDMPFEILAYTRREFKTALANCVAVQDARTHWRRIL